jgi:hypothetical protein
LPGGAYVHNTLELMPLGKDDPAADGSRTARLWDQCEALCKD